MFLTVLWDIVKLPENSLTLQVRQLGAVLCLMANYSPPLRHNHPEPTPCEF